MSGVSPGVSGASAKGSGATPGVSKDSPGESGATDGAAVGVGARGAWGQGEGVQRTPFEGRYLTSAARTAAAPASTPPAPPSGYTG